MTENKSKIHFILIAGFSSDHKEAYGLKKSLLDLGYSSYAISFYGKEYVDDFTHITKEQCIGNVCDYIDECLEKYDEVYGIGISLGGALLLEYAKTRAGLKGIVSVGTPFKLQNRRLIALAQFTLPVFYPIWKRLQKIKKLRLSPVGAGREMIGYMENEFLQNLEKVKTPVLFLQSKKDKVVDWKALEENFGKIGSEMKEIEYFHNGRHVIDHDPDLVAGMALQFLRRI